MANVEKSGYMKYKDKSGNMTTMYPKTKVANVEGLEDWDSAMLLKSAQATLPRAMSWRSVCYGNGKFVAVAYGTNIAAYSTDGITWTQTAMPVDSTWQSVCYGDGKFVAVSYATGGIAAYSSDGVTWTQTAMPDAIGKWKSVCYGNGKFVAISYGIAAAAYSTDGINWTLVTLIDAKYWQSVCYGNGRFVIITGNYSSVVLVSTDGITWSQRSSNVALNWHTVCYGDGKFVALAYNDTDVVYSTDGVNWSRTNMPVNAYWETICYDNGRFVAIARNNAIAAYSTDGITWTQTAMPANDSWQSVCYGNGKFVAVAASSKNVAVSADGVTWSSGVSVVKDPTGTDVTSDLITVLGVDTILSDLAGKETSGAAATALSDAKAYTDQKIAAIPTPESDILDAAIEETTFAEIVAAYNVGKPVVLRDGSYRLLLTRLTASVAYFGGVYNGKYVTAKVTKNDVWTSDDPVDIATKTEVATAIQSAIPATEKGAASGVATLGTDGKIPTEQLPSMGSGWDIETVTLTVPGSVDPKRFSYANGKVFTVHNGKTNTIYCTTDGVNWTSVTLPSTDFWGDVAYGANKYVVCGTGKFAYSEDGITWTQGSMPDSYPSYIYGLKYSGDIFVALSNYSRACAYSTDGVTWTAMSILSNNNSMKEIVTRRYWNGSKYVNVYVCAFSGSAGYIAYSTDGKTWEQRSLPSGVTNCESMFFMSEKLVVDSGTQTYYSTDYGNNWINFAVPITSSTRYMTYCGLGGYAVCVSGRNLAYSADLTEWTIICIPVSNFWSGLAVVSGSKAILCGVSNNKYLITTNLLHWRNQISIIKKDGVDITAQVQAAFY